MNAWLLRRGASTPVVSPYTTTFPLTENPISEGSIWTLGGTNALDWQDVRSTTNLCFGVGTSPGPPFNDCIATLQGKGFSNSKFYSQITVSKTGGYTPPSSHEIEVLFMVMTAHSVVGYEMDFGFGQSVQPVRWNGAIGDFTINGDAAWPDTATGAGFTGGLNDGDIAKFVIDTSSGHPVITGYLNGTQVYQIADTSAGKITASLYPGFGFFARAGAGLDMTKFCIKAYSAGNA